MSELPNGSTPSYTLLMRNLFHRMPTFVRFFNLKSGVFEGAHLGPTLSSSISKSRCAVASSAMNKRFPALEFWPRAALQAFQHWRARRRPTSNRDQVRIICFNCKTVCWRCAGGVLAVCWRCAGGVLTVCWRHSFPDL